MRKTQTSTLQGFYLQWKAFNLLYKRRYISWVVALLGACDVTNNGLGFYQGLEIRLKPREIVIFLCLSWKITHKQALRMILATRFTFVVEKSWRNMYFHSKMAWPPPAYDVISRNHRNWLDSKNAPGMNEQLLRTLDADVSSSSTKTEKNLRRVCPPPPPLCMSKG